MRRLLLAVVCVFLFTATGCETFKGAAKDIENTGENIGEFLRGEKT
jgi:predicted small secreted protein